MRIALAPRVSTDMQYEDGWSFEDQVLRGKEWAERAGHDVVRVYLQPGVAGTVSNRDELLEIVAGARNDEYDGIWIRDLNRFSRSVLDSQHLQAIEMDYGKAIYEDGTPITMLTPEGELGVNVRLSIGGYQASMIRKLTSQAKRRRALSGKVNFSTPPTGYERSKEKDGDVEPREDNGPAVTMIFERFKTGMYSMRQVMEMVNEKGYRTNAGRPFSIDTLTAILRNKFYAGYVPYRGLIPVYTKKNRARNSKKDTTWIKGTHKPLIDEDTWERCRQVRERRTHNTKPTKPANVYLLNGLAVCAGCGEPLRAHSSSKQVQKYRCSSRDRGLACSSTHAYVAEWKLVDQLDAIMRRLVLPDAIKKRVVEMAEHQDTTKELRRERTKLEGQLERAKKLYVAGDYDDEQYASVKKDVSEKLSKLKSPEVGQIAIAMDQLNDAAAMWAGANKSQRRDVLRTLFDAIVVDMDTARITRAVPKVIFAILFQSIP